MIRKSFIAAATLLASLTVASFAPASAYYCYGNGYSQYQHYSYSYNHHYYNSGYSYGY